MRSFDVTHSKQRRTKSKKRASLVLTACASSFDAGRRFLPLLLVIQRGTFFESGTTAKLHINTKLLSARVGCSTNEIAMKAVLLRTEEESPPGGLLEYVLWRQAHHLHDTGQLLNLVLTRKQRVACCRKE